MNTRSRGYAEWNGTSKCNYDRKETSHSQGTHSSSVPVSDPCFFAFSCPDKWLTQITKQSCHLLSLWTKRHSFTHMKMLCNTNLRDYILEQGFQQQSREEAASPLKFSWPDAAMANLHEVHPFHSGVPLRGAGEYFQKGS